MKTLDRNRPYGEVYGASRARFEQDGVLFDHKGHELTEIDSGVAESEKEEHENVQEATDNGLTCHCGKTFDSEQGLNLHQSRYCSKNPIIKALKSL